MLEYASPAVNALPSGFRVSPQEIAMAEIAEDTNCLRENVFSDSHCFRPLRRQIRRPLRLRLTLIPVVTACPTIIRGD
jgi:hypothetical protein